MSDLATLNQEYAAERRRACGEHPATRSAVSHRLAQRVGGRRGEREVLRQCGGCLLFLCVACPVWFACCALAWPGVLAAAGGVAGWFGR